MKLAGLFYCLLFIQPLLAQSPDADLNFLITKITKDYAGYPDKVDQKKFNALISKVAKDTSKDRFYALSQLTTYFKDDHLALFGSVRLTHADTLGSQADLSTLRPRVSDRHAHPQSMEGYYVNDLNTCVIYMKPAGAGDKPAGTGDKPAGTGDWDGYLIESRDPVPPGYRVFRLHGKGNGQYVADYTDPHDLFRVVIDASMQKNGRLVGGAYFQFEPCTYTPGMLAKKPAFNYAPALISLDSQTVLVHMPDFAPENKHLYDSLFKVNIARMDNATTLILDVRNNYGGVIGCFMPVLAYVCKGPMLSVSGWQLCSEDLIADARSDLRIFREKKDSANIADYEEYLAGMEQHRDSFRLYSENQLPCVSRVSRIRHVAILVNHATRSAGELMLLYFKQSGSSSVCLFGENSRGAVDYLDLLSFTLPVSGSYLWVGSTKRKTTAAQPAYDATGIPPDVRIPDTEPDWVGFVREYYRRQDRPRNQLD